MNNHTEYMTQLTNAGLDQATADKVASAAVATDEGRERTREESEACSEALVALFSLADEVEE